MARGREIEQSLLFFEFAYIFCKILLDPRGVAHPPLHLFLHILAFDCNWVCESRNFPTVTIFTHGTMCKFYSFYLKLNYKGYTAWRYGERPNLVLYTKKRKIIFSVAEITNIKREFGLNTNLLVQEQYYSSLLKTGMNNLYLLWWEISFGFIVIAKYRIRSHLGALLANIQRVLKVSKLLKFARYEHFQNVWIVEVNLLTS